MANVWRRLGWTDETGRAIPKPGINPDCVTFTELMAWMAECAEAFPGFADYRLVCDPQHDWTGRGPDEWYVEGLIVTEGQPF